MDWKFFLGIALPAVGAGFIWLTGVARKDPALFTEIDRVLSRWIGTALFAIIFMAGFTWFVWNESDPDGTGQTVIMAGILVLALLQLRSALPFFRRVARLPAAGTQTPTSETVPAPERASASDQ